MERAFLISTTNSIENGAIKKYIDTICSNVVIGTNIFSDISASFMDFFGGRSGSYKRKLGLIYNEAKNELQRKARRIGANAIIGFRVDFGEISGKEKSMFMVSATGTACIVDYNETDAQNVGNGIISQEDLDKETYKAEIIEGINKGEPIKEDWEEFLLETPLVEIVENLIGRYIEYYNSSSSVNNFVVNYLSIFPKKEIINIVYRKYPDNKKEVNSLIDKCRLFDPAQVLSICKQDLHSGINLLSAKKDFYQKEDLAIMIQISDYLDNLPDTGKIEVLKGGLLGKEQKKYICEHGHKNSPDSEFCENYNCNVNIKGLTPEECKSISEFKKKIEALKLLFKKA